MQSVLLSIKPKWVYLISAGRKTLELRKVIPSLPPPFKCFMYCTVSGEPLFSVNGVVQPPRSASIDLTKPWVLQELNGLVVGEWVCDSIMRFCEMQNADLAESQSLVKREEIFEYSCFGRKEVKGLHISQLQIYETPKELRDFRPPCKYRLPDGMCPERKVSCLNQSLAEGTELGMVDCKDFFRRPPQSWCYAEPV